LLFILNSNIIESLVVIANALKNVPAIEASLTLVNIEVSAWISRLLSTAFESINRP